MALSLKGRALHFVFKVGDRTETANFYKNILGMQTLRHEEFAEGCEASCNGLYANRWSKTMFGYGPENKYFAMEITYNYPVKSYEKGNDFVGITIQSKELLDRAKQKNLKIERVNEQFVIEAPGGYKYYIINEAQPKNADPVKKVSLTCSDLNKTIQYWNGVLGLKMFNKTATSVAFAFDDSQCKLEFTDIKKQINHANSYGRIAFSVPKASLNEIQELIKSKNYKILTPMITLDTPDKASVTVIILADPDGHEICFVEDEGFRELSQVDPEADKLLEKYIKADRS